MTEDSISRRQLLRAGAIAGSLGVTSGASAQALLGDAEGIDDTTFSAGTLDLLVGAATDVEPGNWSPRLEELEDGVDVALSEACGTVGIAVTTCGNPGVVSLSTTDQGANEDATTSAEPFVTLVTGDCATGRVLSAGRLSTVLEDLADRVWLHPESISLGKIEENEIVDGATLTFDHRGETVTVAIETIDDGGETVGVDLTVDGAGLSQVNVKGGGHPFPDPCEIPPWVGRPGTCPGQGSSGNGPPGTGRPGSRTSDGRRIGVKPYYFDCATEATGLLTRDDGATAVSHLELFVCEQRCFDCETQPPYPLYLFWAGATTERQLTLAIDAVQCRHVAAGGNA